MGDHKIIEGRRRIHHGRVKKQNTVRQKLMTIRKGLSIGMRLSSAIVLFSSASEHLRNRKCDDGEMRRAEAGGRDTPSDKLQGLSRLFPVSHSSMSPPPRYNQEAVVLNQSTAVDDKDTIRLRLPESNLGSDGVGSLKDLGRGGKH